jgi:elongation factor G
MDIFVPTSENEPSQVKGQHVELQNIRNIGIVAHIDAGKTTTTERILFYSGLIHRAGEVHEGTTVTDWMAQERERGITIQAAAITSHWRGKRINLIDTPGHVDFTVEVERSLRVLDGCIIVMCGVAGVQPQTHTVWKQANRYQVPRLIFVNKLDRAGSDFHNVLSQIRGQLQGVLSPKANAVAVQLPLGSEEEFSGVIDLFTRKAIHYHPGDPTGQSFSSEPIPQTMLEDVERYCRELEERIIETDDLLMEKYLNGIAASDDELRAALRKAVCENKIIPVLCGSAFRNKGVQPLLDAVVDYLPSPLDKKFVKGWLPNGHEETRAISPQAPLAALSFKVVSDSFVGKLHFLRIYSGTVQAGTTVINARTGKRERITRLVQIQADKRVELHEASAGDIVAAIGFKDTTTGDTLYADGQPIILESMKFPPPVISVAIEPRTRADIDKLSESLRRLADEDPTFAVKIDSETGQTIIAGMGELHLEILVDRLLRDFSVNANVGKPQVAYRETIRGSAREEGELIRQTGGKGQFAVVEIELEPRSQNDGFDFVNKITAGVIPKEYISSVETGIRDSLPAGVLAGYPIIGVRATLVSGKTHPVDSSDMAFRIAASMAFKKAFMKAKPTLLEPTMIVNVEMQDE